MLGNINFSKYHFSGHHLISNKKYVQLTGQKIVLQPSLATSWWIYKYILDVCIGYTPRPRDLCCLGHRDPKGQGI